MKEAANFQLSGLSRVKPVGLSGKRLIDIALAGFGIVLLCPLLLLCFAACLLSSPGPAFFGHRRIGFQGKYFRCFKFRTMVINGEEVQRGVGSNPETPIRPQSHSDWFNTPQNKSR